MAHLFNTTSADEVRRIEPHARHLEEFIRRYDPDATFHLHVGHDPEFWELVAYMHPDMYDDPDIGDAIAQEEVEILLDYDVAFSVIRLPRQEEPPETSPADLAGDERDERPRL